MQYFGFDKPSFGFRTFGFGAEFSPLDLFKDGKQGVWYDPSDITTLFQDAAGAIPVTGNGDPVGLIKDKSGNGNHATQPLSASRPTYQTDGILHWLKFDGIDDVLGVTLNVPQPLTVASAHYQGTSLPDKYPNFMASRPTGVRIYHSAASTRVSAGNIVTLNVLNFDKNSYSVIHIANDTVKANVENGAQVTIKSVGSLGLLNPELFRGNDGRIYNLIMISGTVPSDIAIYLANKSGVTL